MQKYIQFGLEKEDLCFFLQIFKTRYANIALVAVNTSEYVTFPMSWASSVILLCFYHQVKNREVSKGLQQLKFKMLVKIWVTSSKNI